MTDDLKHGAAADNPALPLPGQVSRFTTARAPVTVSGVDFETLYRTYRSALVRIVKCADATEEEANDAVSEQFAAFYSPDGLTEHDDAQNGIGFVLDALRATGDLFAWTEEFVDRREKRAALALLDRFVESVEQSSEFRPYAARCLVGAVRDAVNTCFVMNG